MGNRGSRVDGDNDGVGNGESVLDVGIGRSALVIASCEDTDVGGGGLVVEVCVGRSKHDGTSRRGVTDGGV